jgi:hypothetical protein
MMTGACRGAAMDDGGRGGKIISWRANKARWIVFEYINGLVVACVVFFVEQIAFPLELPRIAYQALVLAVVPALYVAASVLVARAREGP